MSHIMPQAVVLNFNGKKPQIADGVFVASGAVVIGDVGIGQDSNIWFNTVVRGDVNWIRIGERTNIQDNSTVHVTSGTGPTTIGNDVTIGHNCVIHACTIGDFSLIGMGSTILDGAVVESHCFIAAGSVVTPGKRMPSGMMCMGSPAKPVRKLLDEELKFLARSARDYVTTAKGYEPDDD